MRHSETGAGRLGQVVAQSFTALSVVDYRYLVMSNFTSQVGQWVQQVAQGWLDQIDVALLEHVSPIEWDNVILYGQYVLDRAQVR